jgi:hypothetical protein
MSPEGCGCESVADLEPRPELFSWSPAERGAGLMLGPAFGGIDMGKMPMPPKYSRTPSEGGAYV